MELKKSAKNAKMRKLNIYLDVLSPKSNSILILRIFFQFLAHFEQEVEKTFFFFFCDFLKNCEFWSKFHITNVFLVKFPF